MLHETICNLCIVTIVGNLALLTAWAAGGIVWFAVGDFFKGKD